MLKLNHIYKWVKSGGKRIFLLNDLSLNVKEGEFVSVMGPSGSGKSTLMNLIGCLDKATTGEIYIAGEAVSSKNKKELALLRRRRLGFVFQSFNLIPVLSAYENVSFALSLLGINGSEIRDRTYGIRLYGADDLAALAARAGFEEIKVHPHGGRPQQGRDLGCMNHRLLVTARRTTAQ